MERFEEVNCAVCSSTETEQISNEGQFNLTTNVVLCKNCGLGYLNPRWDEETYLNFYKNEYDKYYRPSLVEEIDVTAYKANPIINRLEKFNLIPSKPVNILDIGSGAGENILHFKERYKNSNFFAIEPSFESQKHLRQNEITVISDDANSNWDKESEVKYSIIILRHVLEHFLEPTKVLAKIRNSLTDDGIVYFAVPNNLNPGSNLRKKWFRVVHTYYFNKFSLSNILHLANFEILLMTEGDHYNSHELFCVAKKSNVAREINPSRKDFEIQRKVFLTKLKEDNSILHRILKKMKKHLKLN